MKKQTIIIPVKIDAQIFRDFSMFDVFRMKKQWKAPAIFASIMLVSALLCFSRYKVAEQAIFIGIFLLIVGFGFPIVHLINFSRSVDAQIRKLGLRTPQPVYTLTLTEDPDGIHMVTRNGDRAQHEWNNVYGVYRGKTCTYLYVQSNRAYLLPDRDVAGNAEAMENLFREKVRNRSPKEQGVSGGFELGRGSKPR